MNKIFVKLFTLTFLFMALWSSIPSVYGLYQNEITLSFHWSKSTYSQGDSGSVTITLTSTCSDELEIYWVGINFAWLKGNSYWRLDLASNSQRIKSGGSITFSPLSFIVSSDAPVGWNEYFVKILCFEFTGDGYTRETWTSFESYPPIYIQEPFIYNAYQKPFNELSPQVLGGIYDARSANYESPEAKSSFSQAVNEYVLAVSLANQENWQDGVSHLNTAQSLLTQADINEIAFQKQKFSMILGAIVAIVFGAVVVVGIMRRKKSTNFMVIGVTCLFVVPMLLILGIIDDPILWKMPFLIFICFFVILALYITLRPRKVLPEVEFQEKVEDKIKSDMTDKTRLTNSSQQASFFIILNTTYPKKCTGW